MMKTFCDVCDMEVEKHPKDNYTLEVYIKKIMHHKNKYLDRYIAEDVTICQKCSVKFMNLTNDFFMGLTVENNKELEK